MRESIGATWIFGIVIVFVVIFASYLAFSVNYAKAFKVKDYIVQTVEKYNGFNSSVLTDVNTYMKKIGYATEGNCERTIYKANASAAVKFVKVTGSNANTSTASSNISGNNANYCVQKVRTRTSTSQLTTGYYKIYTFFSLNLSIIDISSNMYVSGETISISYPNEISNFK